MGGRADLLQRRQTVGGRCVDLHDGPSRSTRPCFGLDGPLADASYGGEVLDSTPTPGNTVSLSAPQCGFLPEVEHAQIPQAQMRWFKSRWRPKPDFIQG